jgi:Uri superfamily endonuclease
LASLAKPGTYALILEHASASTVQVGALGEVGLDTGYLVYVGSAFGPGGLAGRLRHHLRPIYRPHWHLDYLRPHVSLLGACCASGPRDLEHLWAKTLSSLPGFEAPRAGIGSSGCACEAHLFFSRFQPEGRWLGDCLAGSFSDVAVDYFPHGLLYRSVLT